MMDARLTSRFASLHIEPSGWRLSSQVSANAGLPGLPSSRPQWSVMNEGLLRVHGWNAGEDSPWQGVFIPGPQPFAPERHEVILGVCRTWWSGACAGTRACRCSKYHHTRRVQATTTQQML